MMIRFLILAVGGFTLGPNHFSYGDDQKPPFITHMNSEPKHHDPAQLTDVSGGVLVGNLHHGLFKLNRDHEVVPDLAESCVWRTRLVLSCKLKQNIKYSTGNPILAQDFVRAISHLHNITSIHLSRLSKLTWPGGVNAPTERSLEFKLRSPDPELIEKLASPVFSPRAENPENAFSGPYMLSNWDKGSSIELSPNPHYQGWERRPKVRILFLDEESTALQLFDLGKLDLLRRIPAREFSDRKNLKSFSLHPIYRLDHVGFGPRLKNDSEARQALSRSLDLTELTKIFQSPDPVGCPGIPAAMLKPRACMRPNLKLAQKNGARAKKRLGLERLYLSYSKGSGDDTAIGLEWMQEQWRKKLDLTVELKPLEYGTFVSDLRHNTPPIFRRAVYLDRPTCTAALESFTTGHPDNLTQWSDPAFDALVAKANEATKMQKPRLCGRAMRRLIDQNVIIPLGMLHLAMQSSPAFKGWRIGPMGQLDLTDLTWASP